jgi:hypothetical protein
MAGSQRAKAEEMARRGARLMAHGEDIAIGDL